MVYREYKFFKIREEPRDMTTQAELVELKERFLLYYRERNNLTWVSEQLGVRYLTMIKWRDRDPYFREAWDAVTELWNNKARELIYIRGFEGWEEPLISQGKVVRGDNGEMMKIRRYSDLLAVAYAKANIPEYKEQPKVEVNQQFTTIAETAKTDLLNSLSKVVEEQKVITERVDET